MTDETYTDWLREKRRSLKQELSETIAKLVQSEARVTELEDILADYDNNMLRRFDEDAADSTDLHTYIACLKAQVERLQKKSQ